MPRFLVSACLLGVCCRYDGKHSAHDEVIALAGRAVLIPVCPEQLGGLSTPRVPCEFSGGDGRDVLCGTAAVVTACGRDLTEAFIRGGRQCVDIAKLTGVKAALLRESSPSCGVSRVYCSKEQIEGKGVTTAMLERYGVKVVGVSPGQNIDKREVIFNV